MSINGLEVTDVLIFPATIKSENSCLAAYAKLVINDSFIVSGIRVFEGVSGLFEPES